MKKKLWLVGFLFLSAVNLLAQTEEKKSVAPPPRKMAIVVKITEPFVAAYTVMKGPYSGTGETFKQLLSWMEQNNLSRAGNPMAIFLNSPQETREEELSTEIQLPIAEDLTEVVFTDTSLIKIKRVESVQVVSTYYRGPYNEISHTYQNLMEWIGRNGYQIAGPAKEIYWDNPEWVKAENLMTEIQFPIKRKTKQ